MATKLFDSTMFGGADQALEFIQSVLEASTEYSIIGKDLDGKIILWNQGARRLYGYEPDEMVGKQNSEILHTAEDVKAGRPKQILADALHTGKWEGTIRRRRKNGEEFTSRVVITPRLNSSGQPVGFLLISKDISDEIRLTEENARLYKGARSSERELRDLNTQLERQIAERTIDHQALEIVSKHKSEFLANMSHELRTPLNAIIGFSQVLQEQMFGELNAKQAEYVGDVLSSGQHLLSLINDILDLSKIESGKMDLELSQFSLLEALESGLTIIKERAQSHNIKLSLKIPPALDLVVADERKLKQVMFNLLSNAIKFTPNGGAISVTARQTDEATEIAVTDTGIGIATEDQERVFEEFRQVGTSSVVQHEGTGLGLALVKRLVELHGGRIWLNSELGSGTTCTFTLPAPATPSEIEKPYSIAHPVPVAAHRTLGTLTAGLVLVIDHDPKARALVQLYLETDGFQVALASDANEGLRKARELRPAAIVLEILLPEVDGWSFLSRAKADPELTGIPVVVVSVVDDRGKGFDLGATDYLVKPVQRDRLLGILDRILTHNSTEEPLKVLAIDDDKMALELIATILEPAGFTVLRASGGEQGLAIARRERPAVIILDLMMPDIDGFQVADLLHEHSETTHIPIVVLTSKTPTVGERARLRGKIRVLAQKDKFSRTSFLKLVRQLMSSTNSG